MEKQTKQKNTSYIFYVKARDVLMDGLNLVMKLSLLLINGRFSEELNSYIRGVNKLTHIQT